MAQFNNIKKLIFLITILFNTSFNIKAELGWTLQQSGTNQNLYSIYFINPSTGFVVGANGVFLKTTNSGVNWNQMQLGTNYYLYSIRFPSINVGFIGSVNGALLKSTNSGINWSFYSTGTNGPAYSMSFLNDILGYLITYQNSFVKTTNGGINWSSLPSGIDNINSVFFINESTGFVAGSTNLQGRIEKTTNGGLNSFTLNVPNTFSYNYLLFNNSNTGFSVGNNGTIIKTINAGINWFLQNVTNISLTSISFPSIDTGYICGYFGTILKTVNSGGNWVVQQNFATGYNLHEVFFINNITGFSVGDNGTIIKTTSGGEPIGILPISNKIPKEFALYQNYPNPFNPKTKIKFDIRPPLNPALAPGRHKLSKEGKPRPELLGIGTRVVLKIYNILGSEIEALVNEHLSPGTYEVEFDGSNYPSGIYLYKLSAEGYSETKRMALIK
jgi:photosystem II stability/assembly factor-like uncharacterized protein